MSATPTTLAATERDALADLLIAVGPDAATRCGGWTTRDLAAHLVVRLSRPDAALGIVLPPAAAWTQKVQDRAARRPWPELVREVREGPPWWSPVRLPAVDAATNTIEYFVHHEDVRRALDGWVPRTLSSDANAQLWSHLGRAARLLVRRSPVGVVAAPIDGPDGGSTLVLREATPSVTLAGPTGEIVLAVWGRPTSGLELHGDRDVVEAFLGYPR
jgi:uncharacterized protein (TIGR03085 family)